MRACRPPSDSVDAEAVPETFKRAPALPALVPRRGKRFQTVVRFAVLLVALILLVRDSRKDEASVSRGIEERGEGEVAGYVV